MKNWFSKLREPANIIALATLILTGFGLSAAGRFVDNIQSVTGENGCLVDGITQGEISRTNYRQILDCKNNSTITGSTQK